jgi:hypothetical protein
LRSKDTCEWAHGFSELNRLPSEEILRFRQEIYNIKTVLRTLKFVVLYNGKSKRYEHYKTEQMIKLRQKLARDTAFDQRENVLAEGSTDVTDNLAGAEDDEDEGERDDDNIKRSVKNLNLDECDILTKIQEPYDLWKFDMNKVLDSDDEVNTIHRRPRTKYDLGIIRPW